MWGEEWAHLYLVVRTLRLLRDSLRKIADNGKPVFPRSRLRTRKNGQLVANVFPLSLPDRILYPGFRGEIWMQPGVTREHIEESMAGFYRRGGAEGGVALVLGAGNVAAIGPTDLAQKLFVEGRVCLFKHNAVNEYLAPFLEEAFRDLIRDGFVRTCAGGVEVGEYLCQHPTVDEIHLTGSDRTYEAIVFGAGPEAVERKKSNQPRLAKRVTAELGNVTPVIVVPGPWSEGDILFHAENIATQVANNCGFNCLSARVLVMPANWRETPALLGAIRAKLAALPQRAAYYPGAETRYREILAVHPAAQPAGPRRDGVIPYTLIPGIDPRDKEDPCFATECFMPVLAQTALPGLSAAEYLRNAVEFCNATLWGTLCANLIVHPRTAREIGSELEDAIADLRYGTVAVNHWVAMGYAWGSTSWGAYPGSAPSGIQSGVGAVHNTFMFDKPEKSVVYGPFRMWPKPPWFATHRGMARVFSRATELEARPGLAKALSITLTALRA
jgi:acyl-CoA reductase-like NAD-dependent aldehyde dehydrogenase